MAHSPLHNAALQLPILSIRHTVIYFLDMRARGSKRYFYHALSTYWHRITSLKLANMFFSYFVAEILRRGLSIMAQYKNPIRIWLFHIPYVAITDPEDFQVPEFKIFSVKQIANFVF